MENINIRVGVPGGDRKDAPVWVPLNHAEVTEWIKKKPYDEQTKQELLKAIKNYPGAALRDFVINIGKHVARIQRQRKEKNKDEK